MDIFEKEWTFFGHFDMSTELQAPHEDPQFDLEISDDITEKLETNLCPKFYKRVDSNLNMQLQSLQLIDKHFVKASYYPRP